MGVSSLVQRIVSGVVLIAVTVACLWFPWGVLALACLMAVAVSVEFYRMVSSARYRKEQVLVVASMVVELVILFMHLAYGLDACFLLPGLVLVVAAWICLIFDGASDHAFSTEAFFPLVYVLPASLSLLRLSWPGGAFSWRLTLGLIVLVWINDIGAYCVGMLFGQRADSRKLFPALSPKKSWMGVYGGTVFTFLAAWAVCALWGADVLPLFHWMMLALIVATLSVLGDLFESLIKRHAGVKDAGHFIPGHGGMLDRVDGQLFALPVAALYLLVFQLI